MTSPAAGPTGPVFHVQCDSGRRFVVYNPERAGIIADHDPVMWYILRYPAPLGARPEAAFQTAEDAVQAIVLIDYLEDGDGQRV